MARVKVLVQNSLVLLLLGLGLEQRHGARCWRGLEGVYSREDHGCVLLRCVYMSFVFSCAARAGGGLGSLEAQHAAREQVNNP